MTEAKVIILVSSFATIILFSIPLVESFFRRRTRKKIESSREGVFEKIRKQLFCSQKTVKAAASLYKQ